MRKKVLSFILSAATAVSLLGGTGITAFAAQADDAAAEESVSDTETDSVNADEEDESPAAEDGDKADDSSVSAQDGYASGEEDYPFESGDTDEYPEDDISIVTLVTAETGVLYLSDMDPVYRSIGYGSYQVDKSPNGGTITLLPGGKTTAFEKGIGAHAESTVIFDISGYYDEGYDYFDTYYGVDNSQGSAGNVKFYIYTTTDADYATAEWEECEMDHSAMNGNTEAGYVEVPLTQDMTYLKLYADPNGGNGNDHAVYGDAKLIKSGTVYSDYILRVEEYDEQLKEYYAVYGSDYTADPEYEKLLLKRDLVDKVGYKDFQDLLAENDTQDFMDMLEWLFNDVDFLEMYLTGGTPGGNYLTGLSSYSIAVLADPYEDTLRVMYRFWSEGYRDYFDDHSDNDVYRKMIICLCLTQTGNTRYWIVPGGSGEVDESINYVDPIRRFDIYNTLYNDGMLVDYFADLEVPEMRYVMGSSINDEDIVWGAYTAQAHNYNTSVSYWMKYVKPDYLDDKNYEAESWAVYDEKYNLSIYGVTNNGYGETTMVKYPHLWMCMEDGGICWHMANFCQNLWSSYGRPALIAGSMGVSHEVYLAYNRTEDGNGKWTVENGQGGDWHNTHKGAYADRGWRITRWMNDWGVGEEFDDNNGSYICMAQAAINDYDNFVASEVVLMLGGVFAEDEKTLESVYWDALDIQDFNFDAWYGLIKLYSGSDTKTDAEKAELTINMAQTMTYYPLPMHDLVNIITPSISSSVYRASVSTAEKEALNKALVCQDSENIQAYAIRVVANWLLGGSEYDVASFSFDGENADMLILSESFADGEEWQYSLDGGESWSEVMEESEVLLSDEEVARINADDDILIVFTQVPENIHTIDIGTASAPSSLYANDWQDRLIGGSGKTLEYSTDGGTTWSDYSDDVDLSGDIRYLEVRTKAYETYVASSTVNYDGSFTSGKPYNTATREYVSIDDVSLYAYSSQNSTSMKAENFIDGNYYTHWHNSYSGETGENEKYYVVEFSPPKYISAVEFVNYDGSNGRPKTISLYGSTDAESWELIQSFGEDSALPNTGDPQLLEIDEENVAEVQYLALVYDSTYANSSSENNKFAAGRILHFYEDAGRRSDKTDLYEYVKEVEAAGLSSSDYMTASWNALQNAIVEARRIVADETASTEEAEAALAALRAAYEDLEPAATVSGTIAWSDSSDQDGKRPSFVTVDVYCDGEYLTSVRAYKDGSNAWSYALGDLSAEQEYTVSMDEVDYYTTEQEGYDFTLTHETEKVYITVKITWVDDDDAAGARPTTIRCHLLADGVKADSANLTYSNCQWNYTGFAYRPKYKDGKEINYTVVLDSQTNPATNYTTTYSGSAPDFEIINTYNPGKTGVSVTKAWNDGEDQDGIRPDQVTFELTANGEATGDTITLTAEDAWRGTFDDLPLTDDNGSSISYSVVEYETTGYTSSLSYTASYGNILTNKHTPETVDISGTISWDGSNIPDEVTVRLFADGIEVDAASGLRSYSFTGLPKYDSGEEIIYTVVQDAALDYSTSYDGWNIINTYTPGDVSLTVTKRWLDNYDQDGIRPGSARVELVKDGEETGIYLELTEEELWTGSFVELERESDGKTHDYTLKPVEISGYDTYVEGDMSAGFVVTSIHETETVNLTGKKTWAGDSEEVRPEAITVTVYADGEPFMDEEGPLSKTVTADDGWKWDFGDLDKYSGGEEIVYTVVEDAVNDYVTSYDGYDITNTYVEGKTSITVSKSWDDENDQDGIRPESVSVALYAEERQADGSVALELSDTLELTAEDGWIGTFEVREFDESGNKLYYEVSEQEVTGYEAAVSGETDTGFVITNSHVPETVDIYGTKVWDDLNNAAGARPNSITVNLYADGVRVRDGYISVNAGGNADSIWYWEFRDLPKFDAGDEIVYTVTESPTDNYVSTVEGTDIINSFVSGKISIPVSVTWSDMHDEAEIRPDEINVVLVREGTAIDTLTLSAEGGWTGTFPEVDEYDIYGNPVGYGVVTYVEGYEAESVQNDDGSFTITLTVKKEPDPEEPDPVTHVYDYDDITWHWEEDHSAAYAVVYCIEGDGAYITIEALVTCETDEDGVTTYYAVIADSEGNSYGVSAAVVVEVPVPEPEPGPVTHFYDYDNISWHWEDDHSGAYATLYCIDDDGAFITVEAGVTGVVNEDGSISYFAVITDEEGNSYGTSVTVAVKEADPGADTDTEDENDDEDIEDEDTQDNPDIEDEDTKDNPGIEDEDTQDNPDIEDEDTEDNPDIEDEDTQDNPDIEDEDTEDGPGIEDKDTEDNPDIEDEDLQDETGIEDEDLQGDYDIGDEDTQDEQGNVQGGYVDTSNIKGNVTSGAGDTENTSDISGSVSGDTSAAGAGSAADESAEGGTDSVNTGDAGFGSYVVLILLSLAAMAAVFVRRRILS